MNRNCHGCKCKRNHVCVNSNEMFFGNLVEQMKRLSLNAQDAIGKMNVTTMPEFLQKRVNIPVSTELRTRLYLDGKEICMCDEFMVVNPNEVKDET